jgi:hypothetical protein
LTPALGRCVGEGAADVARPVDIGFEIDGAACPADRRQHFAAGQTRIFEADLADSRRISYEEWSTRPLKERIGERVAALIGPQL